MKKTLILMMAVFAAFTVVLTSCSNRNQTKQEDTKEQSNTQNESDHTAADASETFDIDFFSIVEANIQYIGEDGSARAAIVFDSETDFQIGEYTLSRTIYTGSNTLQVYWQDAEIGEINFSCSPGNAVLKSGDILKVTVGYNPAFSSYLLEKNLTCRTSRSYTVPTI